MKNMLDKDRLLGVILLVSWVSLSHQENLHTDFDVLDTLNGIKNKTVAMLGPYTDATDPAWLRNMDYDKWLADMDKAIESGKESEWADRIHSQISVERSLIGSVRRTIQSTANCFGCKFGVNLARKMMEAGKADEDLLDRANTMCPILNFATSRVCRGILNNIGADVVNVMRHSDMTPAHLCSFFLGEPCANDQDPRHEWKVSVRPPPTPSRYPASPPSERVPTLKILQISDTHYDPHYVEGANADCKEPVCCRHNDGLPQSPAEAAGKWGDYRKCDVPLVLFEHALQHIADTHKDVDAIYWTGDLPPHDVWSQTREDNLANLRFSVQLMRKYFKGVPVFPSIGNHESCPVDSFPPPFAPVHKQISWLYDPLAKEWGRWLPADTLNTVRKGAFYSTLIKPGFRLIAVNGNYCNKQNYYLAWNSTDPLGQLAWLVEQLEAAEEKGEKVHLIGHIPPGYVDCLKSWSASFYDIIARFESTVMAQFYGHTHFDEFELFYDTKDFKRPVGVGYIAPSLTPWENVNPAYRIYHVEGDHPKSNRAIVDHETWKMDLDKANKDDNPVWYKAYSARKAYQLRSLRPKDWDDLVDRMVKDEKLFQTYYKNYYRDSPVMPFCDDDCRERLLCDMRSGRSYDRDNLCKRNQ